MTKEIFVELYPIAKNMAENLGEYDDRILRITLNRGIKGGDTLKNLDYINLFIVGDFLIVRDKATKEMVHITPIYKDKECSILTDAGKRFLILKAVYTSLVKLY